MTNQPPEPSPHARPSWAAPSAGGPPAPGAPGTPGSPGPGGPGAPPPPPGYGGPGGYGAPGYAGAWRSAPEHKPGVVALRPLNLGDLYDGAFKTIRRNPQAMIGLAALVTTAFLLVPLVGTLVWAATGGSLAFSYDLESSSSSGTVSNLANLGSLFSLPATVLLNGMVAHVVAQAVLGRRTTMGEAWGGVRGRVRRLFGLTLLDVLMWVVLVGGPVLLGLLAGFGINVETGLLVGVPLTLFGLLLAVYLQFRFFLLAPTVLVLERTTVRGALRRCSTLTRQQWWRLFGTQLLTALVVGIVAQVITVPFVIVTVGSPFVLEPEVAGLVVVISTYLTQVLVGSLTTPFTAAVTALQYVDQRIRKEGLDVALIAASQATPDGRRA